MMHDEIQQLETKLTHSTSNLEKIDVMNQLAQKLRHHNPQRSLALCESAHELASQELYPKGIANSLYSFGQLYYQLGRYNLSQSYFAKALPLFEELENKTAQADIWNGMGLIQWRLSDYAEAIANHLKALEMSHAVGDKNGEGRALGNLGMVYGVSGAYELAFEMFQKAISAFQSIEHREGIGFALNNMALVHLRMDEVKEAISCAERSLAIAQSIGNRTLELNVLDTIGEIYLIKNDAEQALSYFRQSISLADIVKKKHGTLTGFLNMGRAFALQGKTEQALISWQKALVLAEQLGAKEEQRQCYWEMARYYKQAGDFEQAVTYHELLLKIDREVFNETADMRQKTLQIIHNTKTLEKEAELAYLQNVTLKQEIMRREQTEQALRKSEQNLYRANQMAQLGNFHRIMKMEQSLWSAELCRMAGIGDQARQVTNEEIFQLIHPDDLQILLKQLQNVIDNGGSAEIEFRIIRPDGTMRYSHQRVEAICDEAGEVVELFGTVQDITERHQAEVLLRQAQKMESLGILAGGVAHDFNNLLVAMLGQTSLALRKIPVESLARPHIEKAVNAAKRAADLTQKMLAYSGRGHFEVQPLNLNVLIEENLHLFSASLPKNVYLGSDLIESLPLIDADRGQMQQVVMNLIINGAEAVGEKAGRVLVVTGVESVEDGRFSQANIAAIQLASGQYVTLEISDNGCGMNNETVAKIFDPFFSTKQTGHGLGLAAVLGIIRGHKGGIRVYSEEGQGTTFKLLFPVSKALVREPIIETAVSNHAHATKLVLLIDDEAPVRDAVKDILAIENIEVMTASNGDSGLALYQEHMAEIGLVILDLSMPGINGEETFRRLRQINPDVQVLLSSGYNQIEATNRFMGKGLAGFLQKPYNATVLIAHVTSFLL